MMVKWEEKRLGEIVKINPSLVSIKNFAGKIKYIDISSVNNGVLNDYTIYDFNSAPGRARRKVQANDFIISTVRPNLRAYYYFKDCEKNTIVSTGFAVIRSNIGTDNRFMYYLMTEDSFIKYLTLVAKGATYPAVDVNDFKKAKIKVPPLPIQRRIAEILSVYDDLIENNNRRIELLEKAAQDLYKEWFVRFRFPGYKKVKFENGLPRGWDIVPLGSCCEIGRGSSPRPIIDQVYFKDGSIPWIKIADATKSNKYIFETLEYVNDYGASFSRKLKKGALIIAASGTLGFPMFLGVEGCIHDGWIYFDNFSKITPNYLYFVLSSLKNYFNSISYGAAIQNINTEIVKACKIYLPPSNLLTKFSESMAQMDDLLINLSIKTQNLIKQRDLLLPRLLSGRLGDGL